jgi:UDP-N-acetyl-D-mannosaminuronate dehydrogenase
MLKQKIKDKTVVVAVLGLGHVGYPLFSLFAKNGLQTIGYAISDKRLADLWQGMVHLRTTLILSTDGAECQQAISEILKNLEPKTILGPLVWWFE